MTVTSYCPRFGLAANKKKLPFAAFFSSQFRIATDIDHVSECIPSLFILFTDRSRANLARGFKYVADRLLELGYDVNHRKDGRQRRAGFDYEVALREEYPRHMKVEFAEGCMMHLGGNIRKHAVCEGLSDFMNQEKYPLYFYAHRKIKCISLLPKEKMLSAWRMVKAELIREAPYGSKQKTRNFCQYFDDTYCNEDDSGSTYTISDWCFHRSHNRTQACIESGHFCWHQKAGTHSMCWEFMDWMSQMDAMARIRYDQIKAHGGLTHLKKPEERKKERALDQLWDLLDEETLSVDQFLSAAAVALKMHFAGLDRLLGRFGVEPIDYLKKAD
jgi:hypothetical protein